jgi:phage terminase large subunit-like protein
MNQSGNARHADNARSGRRTWHGNLRRSGDAAQWNLRFDAVGTAVPAAVVCDSPTLLVAAVEDVCLRFAEEDWRARRPHRWHRRAYAAWRAQSEWLEQKRNRLSLLIDSGLALG